VWLMLSPDEREALRGLPHAQRLLYEAIKLKMDGRTFIAGRAARISLQYLRESLEVRSDRGRHSGHEFELDRHRARKAIEGLERAGLVQRLRGPGDELVFLLPVAAAGQSAPGMRARSGRTIKAHMTAQQETSNDAACSGMRAHSTERNESPMRAPPQASVKSSFVVEPEVTVEVTRVAPTEAGALCRRLRAVGVQGVQPHHPALLQALGEGISAEWIESVAEDLVSKGQGPPKLAYVVATARGRWKDREQGNGTGTVGRGRSAAERVDAAFERGEQLARERVSGLRVIHGGREA
jgi:hypothetical protein